LVALHPALRESVGHARLSFDVRSEYDASAELDACILRRTMIRLLAATRSSGLRRALTRLLTPAKERCRGGLPVLAAG
jgi:hypothetical protein